MWVHAASGEPFNPGDLVEVRLTSGDGLAMPTIRSQLISAPMQANVSGHATWWHVGYIRRRNVAGTTSSYEGTFHTVNTFGSPPTTSGCRIAAETLALNASGTVTLASGISITIGEGAWPSARRTAAPQLSVSQLLIPPAAAPPDMRFAAPAIYLEPTGTQFNRPGVNISMPLDVKLAASGEKTAGVFRLTLGNWSLIETTRTLKPKDQNCADKECPFVISHAVGNTLTFSAYALLVYTQQRTVQVTVVPAVTATPPPREPKKDKWRVWWLLYLVFPACGAVGIILLLLIYFRVHYGFFPYRKPKVPPEIPEDHKPKKVKGERALRLKLLEQEDKSRKAYSEELEWNKIGELMQDGIKDEEANGAQGDEIETAWRSNKSDSKHGECVSEPPHPISELVRSGVLMPPRSSIVDGANRKMLSESGGAGAPETMEMHDSLIVADFGHGTTDLESVTIKVTKS